MNGKVVLHGGAGRWKVDERHAISVQQVLRQAADVGMKALRSGGAVDAVEAAVIALEDSAVFNAGRGSVLNLEGDIAMDAGMMDGETLVAGGVGDVHDVPNPIKLARIVMEKTPHVLLVSEGAERLAEAYGLKGKVLPSKERAQAYASAKEAFLEAAKQGWLKGLPKGFLKSMALADTVGAVAIDNDGHLAAATSTGGIQFKLPGRVGDSPLAGMGFYAMKGAGAASATGTGELIAKYGLCLRTINYMAEGDPAPAATKRAVMELGRLFGKDAAGVIALDKDGVPGVYFNTESMAVAFAGAGVDPYSKIVGREEMESFRRVLSRRI